MRVVECALTRIELRFSSRETQAWTKLRVNSRTRRKILSVISPQDSDSNNNLQQNEKSSRNTSSEKADQVETTRRLVRNPPRFVLSTYGHSHVRRYRI